MTITDTHNREYFNWAPPITPGTFYIDFGFIGDPTEEITLTLVSAGNMTEWSYGIDYIISNPTNSGFDISYTQNAINTYTTAGILCVQRNEALTQTITFVEGGMFPVKNVEDASDKLTMISQDLFDIFNRSIRVPAEDMVLPTLAPLNLKELPSIANRKNKYIKFDDDGQPTAVSEVVPEGISISDFCKALLILESAQEVREYIGAASVNGDPNEPFSAAPPTEDTHVITKEYFDTQILLVNEQAKKNYIKNFHFLVNQRGLSTTTTTDDVFFVDRWQILAGGSVPLSLNINDQPDYEKSLSVSTVSPSTLNSGDRIGLQHAIEDREFLYFKQPQILSQLGFWVRSTLAVTGDNKMCVAFIDKNNNSYVSEYNILNANTWEYKTIDISLFNAAIEGTGGEAGLKIIWTMGCGSDYFTTPNIWTSGTIAYATSNQVNIFSEPQSFEIKNPALIRPNTLLPDGSSEFAVDLNGTLIDCQRFYLPWDPMGMAWADVNTAAGYPRYFYDKFIKFNFPMASTPTFYTKTGITTFSTTFYSTNSGSSTVSNFWFQYQRFLNRYGHGTSVLHQVQDAGAEAGMWYITSVTPSDVAYFSCEI